MVEAEKTERPIELATISSLLTSGRKCDYYSKYSNNIAVIRSPLASSAIAIPSSNDVKEKA